MAIDGTWYNELGSTMTITSSGTTISGTFQRTVLNSQGVYNLTGYVGTDANPAVGWVVLWSNENEDSNSLTAWAGQYYDNEGSEVIITLWFLRSAEPESENWKSTLVGQAKFYRSPEQAKRA